MNRFNALTTLAHECFHSKVSSWIMGIWISGIRTQQVLKHQLHLIKTESPNILTDAHHKTHLHFSEGSSPLNYNSPEITWKKKRPKGTHKMMWYILQRAILPFFMFGGTSEIQVLCDNGLKCTYEYSQVLGENTLLCIHPSEVEGGLLEKSLILKSTFVYQYHQYTVAGNHSMVCSTPS